MIPTTPGNFSVVLNATGERVDVYVRRYIDGRLYVHCPRKFILCLEKLSNVGKFSKWQRKEVQQ